MVSLETHSPGVLRYSATYLENRSPRRNVSKWKKPPLRSPVGSQVFQICFFSLIIRIFDKWKKKKSQLNVYSRGIDERIWGKDKRVSPLIAGPLHLPHGYSPDKSPPKHFCVFFSPSSHRIRKGGKTTTFRVPDAKCIRNLYLPLLLAWYFLKLPSKSSASKEVFVCLFSLSDLKKKNFEGP